MSTSASGWRPGYSPGHGAARRSVRSAAALAATVLLVVAALGIGMWQGVVAPPGEWWQRFQNAIEVK